MNKNKLITAVTEAHRFLRKAEELQQAIDAHDSWERSNPDERSIYNPIPNPFYGSKESGSVRRASMDLTRALADMRKS